MAVDVANLTQLGEGNGFSMYRYDTLDTHADVDTAGYFNNIDDGLNLDVGDIMDVVVWATAVRTGTISTYGRHIVNAVADATGIVDLTDVTVGVMTDTD
ncbi:MAG: hypothetical protein V3U84_04240 [Thiotrichaceae bacterium]